MVHDVNHIFLLKLIYRTWKRGRSQGWHRSRLLTCWPRRSKTCLPRASCTLGSLFRRYKHKREELWKFSLHKQMSLILETCCFSPIKTVVFVSSRTSGRCCRLAQKTQKTRQISRFYENSGQNFDEHKLSYLRFSERMTSFHKKFNKHQEQNNVTTTTTTQTNTISHHQGQNTTRAKKTNLFWCFSSLSNSDGTSWARSRIDVEQIPSGSLKWHWPDKSSTSHIYKQSFPHHNITTTLTFYSKNILHKCDLHTYLCVRRFHKISDFPFEYCFRIVECFDCVWLENTEYLSDVIEETSMLILDWRHCRLVLILKQHDILFSSTSKLQNSNK